MGTVSPLTLLKAASAVVRAVPLPVGAASSRWAGKLVAPHLSGTDTLRRNLAQTGLDAPRAAATAGIGNYARYWIDTLALPTMATVELDRRFSYLDYHHIREAQRQGRTPIMVLPHLGSWEWAAAWLGRVASQRVTAVVERLSDEAVFEWFVSTRSSYGVDVVPLGPNAMAELMAATTGSNRIICLLADRDIAGNGVEVEFFGANASFPAGPALLSLRSGNPLLPVAIYDDGRTRRCQVLPPIWPQRNGRLKDDLITTTQEVAKQLEALIAAAPDQWHVLSPVWTDSGG